jgi:hypothetical protein
VSAARGVAAAVAVLVLVAGCDNYNDKRGRGDAPVSSTDDSPAEVVNFPDQFANIAMKCDGHGHRLYIVTHTSTDVPVVVITDPACLGGGPR